MNQFKISLLIPAYTGPRGETYQPEEDASVVPSSALSWSTGHAQLPWQAHLNQLLGVDDQAGRSSFAAQLFNPAGVQAGDQLVVCADPVHLQADRDTATLLAPETLGLRDGEADHLIETLNTFLASDGLVITRSTPSSWFMSGRDGSMLHSHPPSFLANRHASSFLPSGEGTEDWRRLMTEIQMLLHTHPINIEREQRGAQSVNCLWFWGGSDLPSAGEFARDASGDVGGMAPWIVSDDPYVHRLAEHLALQCRSLTQGLPDTLSSDVIVIDTRLSAALFASDEAAMAQFRNSLDTRDLPALASKVASGEIGSVQLINEDGDIGQLDAAILAARAAESAGNSPLHWPRRMAAMLWQQWQDKRSGRGS